MYTSQDCQSCTLKYYGGKCSIDAHVSRENCAGIRGPSRCRIMPPINAVKEKVRDPGTFDAGTGHNDAPQHY